MNDTYQRQGRVSRHERQAGAPRLNRSSTTGAGPYYDNSIHQSAGERDSRDFPKYYKHD